MHVACVTTFQRSEEVVYGGSMVAVSLNIISRTAGGFIKSLPAQGVSTARCLAHTILLWSVLLAGTPFAAARPVMSLGGGSAAASRPAASASAAALAAGARPEVGIIARFGVVRQHRASTFAPDRGRPRPLTLYAIGGRLQRPQRQTNVLPVQLLSGFCRIGARAPTAPGATCLFVMRRIKLQDRAPVSRAPRPWPRGLLPIFTC